MYRRGPKCIDSIATTLTIIQYVEGSVLKERNEIINTDYRAFIVDINLEDYFKKTFSGWDNINKRVLNSSRRLHRDRFQILVEEIIEIMQIEDLINDIILTKPIKETME